MHSDFLSISDVLKRDFSYQVPLHQRNFAWTHEEVSQLWEDILTAMRTPDQTYFLGTIVVQQSDKTRSVIDGQQRLAALTAIFSAIRTIYVENKDNDRAQEIITAYLGTRDRRSREMLPKLKLNEVNEPTFRNVVVEEASEAEIDGLLRDKKAAISNILIAKCVRYFRTKVRDRVKLERSYETFLITLEEFIAEKVALIVFIVDDEADAYLFFETVNARGLELSISDLLKNYLFGKAGSRNLLEVRTQWNAITQVIGAENLTQFLRHYWLSKYEVIRERELYNQIRSRFSTTQSVLALMPELANAANKYNALSSVDDSIWTGFDSEFKDYIENLKIFGVSQFKPLLLACMDVLPEEAIKQVMRMVLVISFRYSVIGSLGTGNIEKAYSDSALAVRDGKTSGIAQIFSHLNNLYPDDGKFKADFESKEIGKAKIARYVLGMVAQKMDGKYAKADYMDETRFTLEHILPKSLTPEWKNGFMGTNVADDVAESLHELNLNRLGNLTLIEQNLNRDLGNAPFSVKQEAYAKSEVPITSTLAKYRAWSPAEIDLRQQEMARLAVQIWRLDY